MAVRRGWLPEFRPITAGLPVIPEVGSPSAAVSDASLALISAFQRDFRRVALYFNLRAKGLRCVDETLENITRSRARRRRGQAACVEEFVVGVRLMNIGLAPAHVVQN